MYVISIPIYLQDMDQITMRSSNFLVENALRFRFYVEKLLKVDRSQLLDAAWRCLWLRIYTETYFQSANHSVIWNFE